MTEIILKSKRKVQVVEIGQDKIAELEDIPEIIFANGVVSTIRNLNKAKLAWLRAGIGGGDFDNWATSSIHIGAPSDSVLKQLTDTERDELHDEIKRCQSMSKKK